MSNAALRAQPGGAPEPVAKIEWIDKAKAEKILERNSKNRKISESRVKRYADMMRSGEWWFDGAALRIDENGNLLDGQHRLWAVIESNTRHRFLVVRNVRREAQFVMDTGIIRTLSDYLSMQGETNVSRLGAVVSAMYKWDVLAERGKEVFRTDSNNPVLYKTSLEFFNHDPEPFRVASRHETKMRSQGIFKVSPRALNVSAYLFERLDPEDAAFFWEKLGTMVGFTEGDPIAALRKRLDVMARDLSKRENGNSATETLALVIKAWNMYRRGDSINNLRWRAGGAAPEAFPTPF